MTKMSFTLLPASAGNAVSVESPFAVELEYTGVIEMSAVPSNETPLIVLAV